MTNFLKVSGLCCCACDSFFLFIQKHIRPDFTHIIHAHALSKERKVQEGNIQCQGAEIWKNTRMHDASMPDLFMEYDV